MPQNFRSAFNGFNREDVVHYLEFINNKHRTEISELISEKEYLQEQLNAVPEADTAKDDLIRELEERCKELEANLAAANEEIAALKQTCDAALNAPVQAAPISYGADQELEAYRRAERAERTARERAELVYHQTNSILSEATAKVDSASAQIGSIAEQVSGQLRQLQYAVDSSRLALKDAAATMEQIRPSADK